MTTYFLTDEALKEHIRNIVDDDECEVLIMDGFSPAAIGFYNDGTNLKVVYSFKRILDILQQEHGMTHENAIEYYEYNIVRSLAYLGETAPMVIEEFGP